MINQGNMDPHFNPSSHTPLLQDPNRSTLSEKISRIYGICCPIRCCREVDTTGFSDRRCSLCCDKSDLQNGVGDVALTCVSALIFTAACGTGAGAFSLFCDSSNPALTFGISYGISGAIGFGTSFLISLTRGCCWVIKNKC